MARNWDNIIKQLGGEVTPAENINTTTPNSGTRNWDAIINNIRPKKKETEQEKLTKKILESLNNLPSSVSMIENTLPDKGQALREQAKKTYNIPPPPERTLLDRVVAPVNILNTVPQALAGAIDPESSILGNLGNVAQASNPFGEGNKQGEEFVSPLLKSILKVTKGKENLGYEYKNYDLMPDKIKQEYLDQAKFDIMGQREQQAIDEYMKGKTGTSLKYATELQKISNAIPEPTKAEIEARAREMHKAYLGETTQNYVSPFKSIDTLATMGVSPTLVPNLVGKVAKVSKLIKDTKLLKNSSAELRAIEPIKNTTEIRALEQVGNTRTRAEFEFQNPEIEAIHQANKGVPQATAITKIKDAVKETVTRFQRPIATLPVSPENAEIYKELTLLSKMKSIVGTKTVNILDDITSTLDKNTFDLFSRKVLLNDLAQEAKLGNKLPNKFTPEEITSELARIESKMTPEIQQALEKRASEWVTIKEEYINNMKKIGVDVSKKFQKEDYFRHQVLEHMQDASLKGGGNRLRTPPNRGYMKARSGEYEGNINTDYLQAEYEVMAQMKHDTEVAKIIKNIETKYDISKKVKQDAKSQGIKNWKEVIPEGYTTWQPKEGNAFYFANSISDRLAEDLIDNSLTQLGFDESAIRQVLAMGKKRKEFVVKQEIADTLNNLNRTEQQSKLSKLSAETLGVWKKFELVGNPRSVIKYNLRNISGDLDAVIVGNPSSLKKVPQSSKELFQAMKNKKFTPQLQSFFDKGGFQQVMYAQEISGVNKLKPFERFSEKSVKDIVKYPFEKYSDFTQNVTNYREMVLRYASYLDYIEQMKKSPTGLPKNFGASKPDIIKGLKTIEDRAFKLSNDLMGAYDDVSDIGKTIRKHFIPFYSWLEVNLKRYNQFWKNAVNNDSVIQTVGNRMTMGLKLAPSIAYKVGKLTITLSALTGVLALWNNTLFPDLVNKIPMDVRSRPHIILGKDANGDPIYFSRLGALNDYLEWFGLGTITQDVKDILDGRRTLAEQIAIMAKQPLNKIVGGLTPVIKLPTELAMGKSIYPDVTKPRQIRDKGQYLAQSVGLTNEYNQLAGLPSKPYLDTLQEAVYYKSNPEQVAYNNIRNLVQRYKEKIGKSTDGFSTTQRSDALYNYKLALKLKDKKSANKYVKEYFKLGGTSSGLLKSISTLDPLNGLSEKDKRDFVETLTTDERKELNLAILYFNKLK